MHYFLNFVGTNDTIQLSPSDMTHLDTLTPKEKEVVCWVLKGKTNHSIASHMDISTNTVKTHLKNVFAKLDVHSRQELIVDILT